MTEQKFKEKLVLRIWFAVALSIIGISLLIFTIIKQGGLVPDDSYIEALTDAGSFGAGYYYGISLGLTFAAIATIIKNVLLLKNQEKFNKQYINETDERNINIIRKSKSISWYFTLYGVLVSTFFIPSEMIAPFLYIIASMVGVYAISYFILQKKY